MAISTAPAILKPADQPHVRPGSVPWPAWSPSIEFIWRPRLFNAVAIVGTPTTAAGNATVAKPTGTSSGHVIVVVCQSFDHTAHTAPSGFSAIDQVDDTGGSTRQSSWFRVANGSEGANFTVGGPASGNCNTGCWTLSGADTTTPVLQHSIGVKTGANHTTTSIDTTGVNGCMLLCFFGSDGASYTSPSGMTNDWNIDGGDCDGSHVIQATGGTVTKSATNASDRGIAQIIAIQPPAGGGGGPVLNDANFVPSFRGMSIGMNRGMR